MTDSFAAIIDQLERQKAAIERALAALRAHFSLFDATPGFLANGLLASGGARSLVAGNPGGWPLASQIGCGTLKT